MYNPKVNFPVGPNECLMLKVPKAEDLKTSSA